MASMPSLPAHCTPTTPFLADISVYFGICVPTPLAFLSTLLGTLSILSWLFAQLPQIYKNYQIQSTAGLSIFFLAEWCLGDATNVLGALFTRQAGWQIILGGYYVFVDVCLVCQYFWYSYIKPQINGSSLHSGTSSPMGDGDSESINGLSPINSNFMAETPSTNNENGSKSFETHHSSDAPHFSDVKYDQTLPEPSKPIVFRYPDKSNARWDPMPSPRTILFISTLCALLSTTNAAPTGADAQAHNPRAHLFRLGTPLEIAGTILSWMSTLLYLGSRLPQLYKNWTRKSTAGLSPLLFIAAFCGNAFYSTSLLTNPSAWYDFPAYGGHGWADEHGSTRLQWIARAAPFFLGAAGVLGMDGAMGIQFLMYSDRNQDRIVKVRDSRGRRRWERVNGWMRGWIPSVTGKERVVDLAESQRLLSQSREMDRQDYGSL